MNKIRSLAIVVCVTTTVALHGCRSKLSQAEAEDIARRKLAEYCSTEGLSPTNFGPPVVGATDKYPWIFDYDSTNAPHHLVRIYVMRNGQSAIHRMIENESSKR